MQNDAFLNVFRQATPYLHAHRNKTFLIAFDGDINGAPLKRLLHDCTLLHSVGVRLILVHGARAQIDNHLKRLNIESEIVNGKRVTTETMMPSILDAVGSLRLRIEATLSAQDGALRVAGGNFLMSKPVGVRDGVDFGFAGEIRKIDSDGIKKRLEAGEIVLLSPLGYSPTGRIYNLNSEEVASRVAVDLQVDKLIYILDGVDTHSAGRQLTPAQALDNQNADIWLNKSLRVAGLACQQGVRRVHLLERDMEGCLLLELFTRDGVGIMVTDDHYDNLRQANLNDIGGLLTLIRPLEEQGILVKRSREQLELEIDRFYLLERDHTIIGCAALYPYEEEKSAELACVVIHPEYRKNRRADHLLEALENVARNKGIEQLFILTTQTAQWFEERGFNKITIADLPIKKQQTYNYQRNSQPYLKVLL